MEEENVKDSVSPAFGGEEPEWSEDDELLPVLGSDDPIMDLINQDTSTDGNVLETTIDDLPRDDGGMNHEFYNPIEFNSLNVSNEIKELFQYITKYRPQILEVEVKLKPFIPDYIPAVGDPDAFLKVDRPDGKPEPLGLYVLDEPSLHQSDPSVLDLKLRSVYKQSSTKAIVAKSVSDSNKSKAIDKWIKDISELHRSKPLPTVTFTKPLPDIDTLMGEWPPEVEEAIIKEHGIPPPDLDCDVATYVDIACGLLEIPVYPGHQVHSLHLLLTLYSEISRLQK